MPYVFLIISRWFFFLQWEILPTNVVQKIKIFILLPPTPTPKSWRLWDNVEKYCRSRQVTDDSIILRMRIACWIPKGRDTHSEYVILIAVPRQQWLRERAPQCYVIRILSVLCISSAYKQKPVSPKLAVSTFQRLFYKMLTMEVLCAYLYLRIKPFFIIIFL